MNRKKIKIKHRKYNLYKRKTSKGKQFLAVLLTIIVVAGLGVVGFGVGMALLGPRDKTDTPSESSLISFPPQSAASEPSEESPDTSQAEESKPEEKPSSSFILPEDAVLSSESLNSALAAAKNTGCDSVTVTLKSAGGTLLYKTGHESMKDSDAVTGGLTAKQICDIITKAGFEPVARISALNDNLAPAYIKNAGYMFNEGGWLWLDNYDYLGGKPWIDPFQAETVKYISDIAGEAASSGFRTVVLADVVFPPFIDYDYSVLPSRINDDELRQKALWNVISACSGKVRAAGGELIIEMDGNEISALNKRGSTAEAAGTKQKLKEFGLLLDFVPGSTNSPYIDAKSFTGRLGGQFPGQKYAVRITTAGFSEAALTEIKKAFAESGIEVYYE